MARPIILIPYLFLLAGAIKFRKDYSPPSSPPSRPFNGFVECDLTGLHHSVSFKVKNMICMRVRSITKKNTVRGPGHEPVQITFFQDEAFAPQTP